MSTLTQNTAPAEGESLLSWSARPYHVHDRDSGWYIRAGIAAALIAVYAVVTASWTFAIVILLGCGLYFLLRNHEPAPRTIEIFEGGVRFEGRFWDWKTFKGFFLKTTPAYTSLHILPASKSGPMIVLQTGDADVKAIRETLSIYIAQLSDAEESLLDSFIRFCKL